MPERRRLFRDEAFARRGRSEPIDGLLRVSAPHEWLFGALLGCALIGLLAWAVFGTLERGISTPCTLVAASGGVDATARLAPGDARRIAVGMPARVSVEGTDDALDGHVAQVGVPGADADGRRPLLVVRLSEAPAALLREADTCRLHIVTDRGSPIRLIVSSLTAVSAARPA